MSDLQTALRECLKITDRTVRLYLSEEVKVWIHDLKPNHDIHVMGFDAAGTSLDVIAGKCTAIKVGSEHVTISLVPSDTIKFLSAVRIPFTHVDRDIIKQLLPYHRRGFMSIKQLCTDNVI